MGIEGLLFLHCEQPQLYLKYDLKLSELAEKVGMSRETLGTWFTEHADTYNAYINRLRIDHFMRLYRESVSSDSSVTATELAKQSGFRSYSTFSAAFKQFNGQTVAAWMKSL